MPKRDLSVAEQPGEFDPTAVPMYPMLRAEIRDTDDGEYVGLVDDEVVATDLDVEPVRAAIVAKAAGIAGRRLGDSRATKAVRVRVQAPDGEVFQTVVTAAEQVYDVTAAPTASSSTAQEARRSAGKGKKSGTSSSRSGKGRVIRTPDDGVEAKRGIHPLMLVIVGFPVLFVGFFVWILVLRGSEDPASVKAPQARQLPVAAPAGYSPVATWAVKVGSLSGASTGGVTADAERVYAAAGSADRVRAYEADTGIEAWDHDLGSSITTGPLLAAIDGRQVVVVSTSTTLVALDPADGSEVGEWKLDAGAGSQVRVTASGPVVIGRSNHAQIVVDGKLVDRVMPAGALPVAPGQDGSLISVTRDRVYVSTSDRVAGPGAPIEAAATGQVSVAGWTGTRLVLAYATSASTTGSTGIQLAAYDAPAASGDAGGTWSRRWVSKPLTAGAGSAGAGVQLPLATGPAGAWGIYAATVVTLTDGSTADIEGWTTVSVGDQIAFGTGGSNEVLSAGPDGLGGRSEPGPASVPVTAPQAVDRSSAYLVTAGGETDVWLYALVPSEGGAR